MTKTNAIRLCETAKLPMKVQEYGVDDGRIDALSIAEKLGEPPEQVFKTLVTQGPRKEHFVFVLPAAGTLDLKRAAAVAGVKSIEMIPQKELLPLTGYVHGGCSPVGMKKLFPTFIDETALLYDHVCVSGGRIGCNLKVAPEPLAALIGAVFADVAR